ncbi:uracil-DNA glycosylase [Candidatus Albibeggiatoa sp. nov. NOAA]|uniref:uracil-DNA glycosylase n=1 Tax=Candidatus Albibeggiatoa sp. nov. NOAA TaxID=3162724 RepID=UPI0033045AFD|nr:uracil-DNA glycosylase [Thiotrichaceae bacterium]
MLDDLHQDYLRTMDIDIWVRRELIVEHVAPEMPVRSSPPPVAVKPQVKPVIQPATPTPTKPVQVDHIGWDELRQEVAKCTACPLHQSRTQTVFGVGNPNADILLIGEAPGADEDRKGEPFVGRAGQLLNKMLYAIQLQREDIFIANILKCRPPDNRNPTAEEKLCCTPFLKRQIALIQPKVIIALGRVAATFLLDNDKAMGALRNQSRKQTLSYADTGVRVLATYHPAYLLRSNLQKRKAWEDLQLIKQIITEQGL